MQPACTLGRLATSQCASPADATVLSARVACCMLALWRFLCHLVLQLASGLQRYLVCKHEAVLALGLHCASRVGSPRHLPNKPSAITPKKAPAVSTPNAARVAPRSYNCLLPPLWPHHQGRLTVVLDLDKTLLVTFPESQIQETFPRGSCSISCWLQYSSTCPGAASTLAVLLRPGYQQFLTQVASFAEVVLFSAASAAYAQPLVRLLDPRRTLFTACLYKDATVRYAGRDGVKDVSALGRDLCRVVLIDNSPYSFLLQPNNGIPCKPYNGEPGDKHLLEVMLPLLRILSEAPDVRPVLGSKFQMAQWLSQRRSKCTSSS